MNFIIKKINTYLDLKDFPHITQESKWITTKDGYWTGGFWVGLLWLLYKNTRNEVYKDNAYYWLQRLEERKKNKTFDLGFLFYPSFVLGYRITKDNKLKYTALEAADTLVTTYNEKLKFMYDEREINDKKYGRIIIDIMMNLPLLWWGYKETKNREYYDIAYTHSNRTIEELIREDYSTIQGLIFDLKTLKIIEKRTFQGISVNSCWSRGQAWGLYGFILDYKNTNDPNFLKVAMKLAKYFIKNLPKDNVPYWDFNVTSEHEKIKDTSAAAIASSGLLEIYKFSKEVKFKEVAFKILKSLSKNYLTGQNEDGILSQGCFHNPESLGVKESLIWGDYYFTEALLKIKKEKIKRI